MFLRQNSPNAKSLTLGPRPSAPSLARLQAAWQPAVGRPARGGSLQSSTSRAGAALHRFQSLCPHRAPRRAVPSPHPPGHCPVGCRAQSTPWEEHHVLFAWV